MTQSVSTLPTSDLECPRSLLVLGHTVLEDGLSEGRPGGGMLILRSAGEQLVSTLGTHIQPSFKVVFKDLTTEEGTK